MDSIGLVVNLTKDCYGTKTREIIEIATDLGMDIMVSPEIYEFTGMGIPVSSDKLYSLCDGIISLGGDGTLLQAARQAAPYNKPIMGINTGTLGFLTDVDFTHSEAALSALKAGNYTAEKRMMIEARVLRDGVDKSPYIAFNDIGIMKSLVSRIIHLKARINGHEINDYSGDGLLISSPTGSTAYSLSAGGPIVNPSLECLLLTPICPHSLNARSIITNSHDVVEIEIMSRDRNITLTADGQAETTLILGDRVIIKKADIYVNLLHTKEKNFFELLHEKIPTTI